MDRLSKGARFIPLSMPFKTKSVSEVFSKKKVFQHHGFPKTLLSNKDPIFLSNF